MHYCDGRNFTFPSGEKFTTKLCAYKTLLANMELYKFYNNKIYNNYWWAS